MAGSLAQAGQAELFDVDVTTCASLVALIAKAADEASRESANQVTDGSASQVAGEVAKGANTTYAAEQESEICASQGNTQILTDEEEQESEERGRYVFQTTVS